MVDAEIAEIREQYGLTELEKERADIKAEIDKIIIDNGLEYDTDTIRIVRVQGHQRVWNIDKLEKIMPRSLFRKVVKMTVDGEKVDQLVREGKIDDKQIAPAFEETPNKAYARWAYKSDKSKGKDEAVSLAEKLK